MTAGWTVYSSRLFILKENNLKNMSVVGFSILVIIILCFIVFWPLVIIFALNTVFVSLSIPYTFWTWLSICILQMSTFGAVVGAINKLKD